MLVRFFSYAAGEIWNVIEKDGARRQEEAAQWKDRIDTCCRVATLVGNSFQEQFSSVLETEATRFEQNGAAWKSRIGDFFSPEIEPEKKTTMPLEYDLTLTGRCSLQASGSERLETGQYCDMGPFPVAKSIDSLGCFGMGLNDLETRMLDDEKAPGFGQALPRPCLQDFTQNSPTITKPLDFRLAPTGGKGCYLALTPLPEPDSLWKNRVSIGINGSHLSVGIDLSQNPSGTSSWPTTASLVQKSREIQKAECVYRDYQEKELEKLKIANKVMPNRRLDDSWHKMHVDSQIWAVDNPFDPSNQFQLGTHVTHFFADAFRSPPANLLGSLFANSWRYSLQSDPRIFLEYIRKPSAKKCVT